MSSKQLRRRKEAERYQIAAEEALHQLEWLIDYLHRMGDKGIAAQLKRNHDRLAGLIE
jgi:hypothetical protein